MAAIPRRLKSLKDLIVISVVERFLSSHAKEDGKTTHRLL